MSSLSKTVFTLISVQLSFLIVLVAAERAAWAQSTDWQYLKADPRATHSKDFDCVDAMGFARPGQSAGQLCIDKKIDSHIRSGLIQSVQTLHHLVSDRGVKACLNRGSLGHDFRDLIRTSLFKNYYPQQENRVLFISSYDIPSQISIPRLTGVPTHYYRHYQDPYWHIGIGSVQNQEPFKGWGQAEGFWLIRIAGAMFENLLPHSSLREGQNSRVQKVMDCFADGFGERSPRPQVWTQTVGPLKGSQLVPKIRLERSLRPTYQDLRLELQLCSDEQNQCSYLLGEVPMGDQHGFKRVVIGPDPDHLGLAVYYRLGQSGQANPKTLKIGHLPIGSSDFLDGSICQPPVGDSKSPNELLECNIEFVTKPLAQNLVMKVRGNQR